MSSILISKQVRHHTIRNDVVNDILNQWTKARPELDTAPLGLELWEYDVLSALRRRGKPFALPATCLAKGTGLSAGDYASVHIERAG